MESEKMKEKSAVVNRYARTLYIIKKRHVSPNSILVRFEEKAIRIINIINSFTTFEKYYETRIRILPGDVFRVRFYGDTIGNELEGSHFFVAIVKSEDRCQTVTVVPLKSLKRTTVINPSSDVELGPIMGLNKDITAIAVVNQIRTIDKRRLFTEDKVGNLYQYYQAQYSFDDEIPASTKNFYRLTKKQMKKLRSAVFDYLHTGKIVHRE